MEVSVFLEQILFVIVLYKQKPEESPAFEVIQSLALQGNHSLSLFIYDNSPERAEVKQPFVFYRHDPQNSGVSKAYNEAFGVARDLNKKWMLLLDQDTGITIDYIDKLIMAVEKNPTSIAFVPTLLDRYGVVSPFRWILGGGRRISMVPSKLPLTKFRFLNSGLLISLYGFGGIRGFDESIPLYFSDIAFGEKLIQVIDHFIAVDATLQHGFSATENISVDAALHRYFYFCTGAFAMGRTYGPFWIYYGRALLRALNLSVRYKKIAFLKTFFTSHG